LTLDFWISKSDLENSIYIAEKNTVYLTLLQGCRAKSWLEFLGSSSGL